MATDTSIALTTSQISALKKHVFIAIVCRREGIIVDCCIIFGTMEGANIRAGLFLGGKISR